MHRRYSRPYEIAGIVDEVTRTPARPWNVDPTSLFSVWNWLPAFCVVAQTQHLPAASNRLHLSVSALSRTIRLLEEALGRPLFRRVGRSLELNSHGQRLLSALERAIGGLASEIDWLTAAGGPVGPLHVGVAGPLSQGAVIPVLRSMQTEYAEFVPYLHGCRDGREASRLLLAGDLDLVLCSEPISDKSLFTESLGRFSNGVYCGAGHPLFRVSPAEPGFVLRHPFVACFSRMSVWPTNVLRKVGLYVNQEETALDLCLGGEFLAVLPDAVAHSYARHRALWRLPFAGLSPSSLYVAWRMGDESRERIAAVVAAVRRNLGGPGDFTRQAAILPGAQARPRSGAADEEAWRLGDSLLVRAEYGAAQRAYRAALRRLSGSAQERVGYLLRRARIALMLARYAETSRHCRAALALDAAPAQRAIAESMLAILHCYRGELSRSEAALLRAHASLEAAKSNSPLEGLRATVAVSRAEGTLCVVRGQPLEANRFYLRGAEAAKELPNGWEYSIALGNMADAYLHARKLERALAYFDQAACEKEGIGDRWGMCYLHHGRAFVFLERGQIDRALREAANGLKLAIGVSDLKLIAMLDILLGRAHLVESDLKSARRAFRFALRAAARCKARYEIIQATIGLAGVELRKGDLRAASDRASRARALAARTGSKDAMAATLATCAAVQVHRGSEEKARQLLRSARKLVSRTPHFYGFWFAVSAAREEHFDS